MHRIVRRALLPLALGATMLLAPVAANASYAQGNWALSSGGETKSYTAQIQQPIDPDGTSVWSKKRGVIPVQFKVTETDQSKFSFESVLSDNPGNTANDWSALNWTPPPGMTVAQLTSLVANYTFLDGHIAGGSLRWMIRTDAGEVEVLFGDTPDYLSETLGLNGSGVNLLSDGPFDPNRFNLTAVGGQYYGSRDEMIGLIGNQTVQQISLIVDSGWKAGDQVVDLDSASVNGDTFTMPASSGTTSFQTNAPTAKITVAKWNNNAIEGQPDETLVSTQGDTSGTFRQVDGKYIYNLETTSFNPSQTPGDYKVFINIDGKVVGEGRFSLK